MKQRYRMFLRRKSVYYAFDTQTKTYESLKTRDKAEAARLLVAMNEAGHQPAMNLSLARVYLRHSDPMVAQRTWQHVLDECIKVKSGENQHRWKTAAKDEALDSIRNRPLIETQPEHLLHVMQSGTVSTNVYLRRLHNFACDMNWLMAPVLVKEKWPQPVYQIKRAITLDEHQRIIAREHNAERRGFYELAWHTGASQSDLAHLHAEDIDWQRRIISYERMKIMGRARRKAGAGPCRGGVHRAV